LKLYEQVEPQLIPAGLLVTEPDPVPFLLTLRVGVVIANVAVTDRAAVIETVHEPVPEQAPDQPVKVDPAAGLAVNVTEVP
jgi:hypothetical protein